MDLKTIGIDKSLLQYVDGDVVFICKISNNYIMYRKINVIHIKSIITNDTDDFLYDDNTTIILNGNYLIVVKPYIPEYFREDYGSAIDDMMIYNLAIHSSRCGRIEEYNKFGNIWCHIIMNDKVFIFIDENTYVIKNGKIATYINSYNVIWHQEYYEYIIECYNKIFSELCAADSKVVRDVNFSFQ